MPRERLNGLGASGMRQTEALPQPRVPTGAGGKVEGNEFQLCDLEVPPPPPQFWKEPQPWQGGLFQVAGD